MSYEAPPNVCGVLFIASLVQREVEKIGSSKPIFDGGIAVAKKITAPLVMP